MRPMVDMNALAESEFGLKLYDHVGRSYPMERVDLEHRQRESNPVYWGCHRHCEASDAIPTAVAKSPTLVVLNGKGFTEGSGRRSTWIYAGQCPKCGTIYWSAFDGAI